MDKAGILRLSLLLAALAILAALISPGCDKLVTEVNTNNIFDTTLGEACLQCHNDSANMILLPKGQWENSRHASPRLIETTVSINDSLFQTNLCGPLCHTSEGFISYALTGQATSSTTPTIINCYTCHMPHTGEYGTWSIDTLRGYQSPQPLANGGFYDMGRSNMCVPCHQAAQPPPIGAEQITVAADFGPHYSPQADVVSGTGGFQFGLSLDTVTHRGIQALNGCDACHYGNGVGYEFGEHTFRLENDTTGQQYVANCNVSGCHSSELVTDFYQYDVIDSIGSYATFLEDSLKSRNILDPSDPNGIAIIPDSLRPVRTAQLLYNYLLYKLDGSRGVHNPVFVLNLLKASVNRWDSIPPTAKFSVSDASPCIGTEISFTNQTLGNDTAYAWDFGDNIGTDSVENPVYTYDVAGPYTVTLVATGPGGSDSASLVVNVRGAPGTAFSADTTAGCNSLTVGFTDESTDVLTRLWDFGDGSGPSVLADPTHTYTAPGSYTVTLITANNCGVDTLIMADFIRVYSAPPVAAFTVDVDSADTAHTFQFTDQSTDAETWEWDFGDQSAVSTEQSPTHKYEAAGGYAVWLKVTNPCGVDSTSIEIIVSQ
ncbi:MAG: PKD domain-containing protein [Candidatus Zixiibacteriota bacterium]|jgi:PKD repeat protein